MGEATREGGESAEADAADMKPAPAAAPAPARASKFTLRDGALIAEIIGATAVVFSLIFVGVQLAQSNKLERNAAAQRQVEAVSNLQRTATETPAIIEAFGKAGRGEEVSIYERMIMESFLMYSDRTWEGLYLQYLDGQIDRDLWEAHRAQARPVHNHPAARAVWGARRMWFTPRYRAFRDAELEANTDERFTYEHFDALEKPQPDVAAPAEPDERQAPQP